MTTIPEGGNAPVKPGDVMRQALKEAARTQLRPHGWTGSFPHLRRRTDTQICLITFQFSMSGGSFTVEVAECGPDGITTSWGQHVPANKVTAHDINIDRLRLGSARFPSPGDHWFVFGPRNYEAGGKIVRSPEVYSQIADEVMRLVHVQAEPWWEELLRKRLA